MEFSVRIRLTYSKIIALVVLGISVWLTLELGSVTPFSIAVPAASAMIVGKQVEDMIRKRSEKRNEKG